MSNSSSVKSKDSVKEAGLKGLIKILAKVVVEEEEEEEREALREHGRQVKDSNGTILK